jgi:hypothetical protein
MYDRPPGLSRFSLMRVHHPAGELLTKPTMDLRVQVMYDRPPGLSGLSLLILFITGVEGRAKYERTP